MWCQKAALRRLGVKRDELIAKLKAGKELEPEEIEAVRLGQVAYGALMRHAPPLGLVRSLRPLHTSATTAPAPSAPATPRSLSARCSHSPYNAASTLASVVPDVGWVWMQPTTHTAHRPCICTRLYIRVQASLGRLVSIDPSISSWSASSRGRSATPCGTCSVSLLAWSERPARGGGRRCSSPARGSSRARRCWVPRRSS